MPRPFLISASLLAAATLCGSIRAHADTAAEGAPHFNRDIRPILSDKCFFCHGPDGGKRKAGLRLDVREAAIEDGALVPGNARASELFKRITTTNIDDVMPPADVHKVLTSVEVELLRRWIDAGAPFEPHWAYVPVMRPPVPTVLKASSAIDAFVAARLAQAHLEQSPPADRRTLLRRLSLDIVGLPPTPTELQAFERDKRSDAVERQIDRLLRSPHFGERMAVPWLDAVRYADTVGYHGDQNQHVFPYRDYVVNAFNTNKRFDQFTLEQIAGDLLPKPTEQQLIASAFNRLNMVTREGGAQPGEYLAKYMGDRVRAIGTAWMGSTVGCAECHDHKYDPISTRDFYSMGAFFADIREWGVYADYPYTPNPELKGLGNDDPFPPEIEVRSAFLEQRSRTLSQRLRKSRAELMQTTFFTLGGNYAAWLQTAKAFLKQHPDGWRPLQATAVEPKAKVQLHDQGAIVAKRTNSPEDKHAFFLEAAFEGLVGSIASLRLDLIPHEEHQGSHLREGKTRSTLRFSATLLRAGQKIKLPFSSAAANAATPVWKNGHKLPDIRDEWKTPPGFGRDHLSAVWDLALPQTFEPGDKLLVGIYSDSVGALSLYVSPFASSGLVVPTPFGKEGSIADPNLQPNALARYLTKAAFRPNDAGVRDIFVFSGAAAKVAPDAVERFYNQGRAWQEIKSGKAPVVVTVSRPPRITRVLPRGNWQDETGPEVAPAVLHFLPQLPATATANGRRATRLDLARWLTARENPLTARAFMNRLWKQFFGTGLSLVLDDLGGQGEPPTHPELLDWLAAEFMDSGWNIKHMVKLLTMSATYRQDSTARPELMAVDPQNRLLGRQSQRRLDAEFVRDNALFIAGLLNQARGGPSVFPYQPDGHFDNIEFPTRAYVPNDDEQQHRRGLYMHWQRTFLHPMLSNFDAPSREECTADRPQSNTPQQALTLLNDPTFVEAAQTLARRLLQAKVFSDNDRIALGFELATGRKPSADEAQALHSHLQAQRNHYAAHLAQAAEAINAKDPIPPTADAATLAAWTSLSRVLLNVYETLTRI